MTAICGVSVLAFYFPDGDDRWKKLPGRTRFWRTLGLHFPVLLFVGIYEFALRSFAKAAYFEGLGVGAAGSGLSIGTAFLLVYTPPGLIGGIFAGLVFASAWGQSKYAAKKLTGTLNGMVFVLGIALLIAIPFGLLASFMG